MELDSQICPEEIMSREMELDPQVCPEEIMNREVELDIFCFELSKLFVNSSGTDIDLVTLSSTAVETAIA